jgi:hypothetical protein
VSLSSRYLYSLSIYILSIIVRKFKFVQNHDSIAYPLLEGNFTRIGSYPEKSERLTLSFLLNKNKWNTTGKLIAHMVLNY